MPRIPESEQQRILLDHLISLQHAVDLDTVLAHSSNSAPDACSRCDHAGLMHGKPNRTQAVIAGLRGGLIQID